MDIRQRGATNVYGVYSGGKVRTSECPKCRGDEYLQPCEYCGASVRAAFRHLYGRAAIEGQECDHGLDSDRHYLRWPDYAERNVWNPLAPECEKCGETVGEILRGLRTEVWRLRRMFPGR